MPRPALLLLVAACSTTMEPPVEPPVPRPPPPDSEGVYGFAEGCYAMDATDPGSDDTRWLAATADGESFAFVARSMVEGARFFMKPSDLGTYLFFDAEGRYLTASDEGDLGRPDALLSDVLTIDDAYVSDAEWIVEASPHDERRFQVRHLRTDGFLGRDGVVSDPGAAGVIAFYSAEGCAAPPELTLDAEGEVTRTHWDDGTLFGIVDAHEHMFTNFGFGGGGVFHGSPFHRLGVEHALPDCDIFHGPEGRGDFLGFGFDAGGDYDPNTLITAVITGRLPEFNHYTAGYPEFTDWPHARESSTHQTQYYKWIERAWMGGLRLVIQHGTSNSALCEVVIGSGAQPVRYSCNDMVAIDRQIEETRALERYVDAHAGGPGQGWFRVVETPAEARAVIGDGKLAVVLGIEVSNLFDCFLTPPEGFTRCTEADVVERLDHYYDLGVRVLFPVHKYDNAFSAGDGSRGLLELGNWINSGHWSNFVEDCPTELPVVFDRGDLTFGGLNMPRAAYDSPAPLDFSDFAESPFETLSPHFDVLMEPPLEGDFCMNAGLTELGEVLMVEMMKRGMVIEIDHFSRRAYESAITLLETYDYPAAGTHGTDANGRLYALGGISIAGIGRCADPARPSALIDGLLADVAVIEAAGGYPAEGFGFDFNGFAGAPGPRFGDRANCALPQEDPVTHPFTSYGGDVTFTEPRAGNRVFDFNTEGMAHIGLMPELVEDARRTGVTDEELEPLFRSAEGYLRMWERAVERASAIR